MWQLDLNNNYTVPLTYPGIRNPLNDQTFRQALSCAVDKQYIVDEILLGDGRILNVPISLNSIS
jgi:ABC-type oligopeptide transport system substrate-binding subunit